MKPRHDEIMNLLKQKIYMGIDDLCQALDISPATARRDLNALEQDGVVVRLNGGAMLVRKKEEDKFGFLEEDPYMNEKVKLAEAAAKLVNEGDTIFMDAGSTNRFVADQLSNFHDLTIITNSIVIANRLINRKHLSVIVCGGTLGEANPDSVVGPIAEKMISMFRANLCFIGTSGIEMKHGITDKYISAGRIKEIMIANSNKTIMVTDRSKFGVTHTAFVCQLENISHIVTDQLAPKDDINHLRSRGITVTLV